MVLEVREVSRKTARDGRLEISEGTARRLAPLGESVPVEVDGERGSTTLESMTCTCTKGGGAEGHEHHFLHSTLFSELPSGVTVVIELLDGARLAVARPHPLGPE